MEIYHQYLKLRKQFGRWPKFADEGSEMLADIRPNEDHGKEYIPRNPVTTVTQCVPEMSEHEANTNAVILVNKAMSHVEGGWPKDVDYAEAEHTIRYRKKVEKDEDYIKTVVALGASVEDLIKQNNAVDIYEEYFTNVTTDHTSEAPHVKTITVFKDPSSIKRSASYVNWHPDGSVPKVVISYSILQFQQQPAGMPLSSYMWDVNNPNTPEYEMVPTSQICCAKFNLKDNNIIGAGQYNGQMAYFDVRKGNGPVEATPIDFSHRDPVYDFAWLQSKTGTECMTVSTDGMVFWWDLRKMSESVESMPLKEKNSETMVGGVALEYDTNAGPTNFMVGTEQGQIFSCNRKAKNPVDRVKYVLSGHHGPIYGLRRNPFNSKYFLSIGDWTARVWVEDTAVKTPILTTKYHPTYLTGGTWSPSRPGVFFTIKMDGAMDVWDLFYKHNEPTLTVQVSDLPLTAFAVQESGSTVAVGTSDGCTSILQLSQGLSEAAPTEKSSINAMFERETTREKNLEKAMKEAKVKARKEQARRDEVMDHVTEEQLKQLEDEFFKTTDGGAGSGAPDAGAE
ncbi:Dynein, intermediate chain, flagellar outer arm [Tetrabaena socialis]|uniref:Dynein, intermediate chain, flagellar outer arm n=1 Tax=Tetrabaena socialis TaxID=47790 RepID=A0A2J8AFK3_9CHLO|nr:Dynein, intermediate chain, flagellar outer arm [Tetrabaena socialis]|eukprot:PNH11272.1 Dynein, intermediate chain, flagellar outer arm [Tetrabaena socialis]